MLPLIVSVVCAIIMMFSAFFLKKKESASILAMFLMVILIASQGYEFMQFHESGEGVKHLFEGHMMVTSFSLWLNLLFFILTFFYFIVTSKGIEQVGRNVPEYYALIFFILSGLQLMTGFGTLLILFLGIELMSIPQYILAGSDKNNMKSSEASLKYFLMGAFSTGFLLMGIALLYAYMGSFHINEFNFDTENANITLGVLGLLLIVLSFGFKVSAAPVHYWTADVYDGAPTPFTSYMATIVKVGIFVGFVNIFINSFSELNSYWQGFMLFMIIATLVIGNFTAITQQSVKRMLAYSSIAQAGFMLMAVFASNETGMKGITIYAVAYSIASISIFSVIVNIKDYTYEGFNGLAKKEPFIAFVLTVCLLSLTGIPLTAGFFAKFYVLKGALEQGNQFWWMIIIALAMAATSAYYYFKLIQAMYFKSGDPELKAPFTTLQRGGLFVGMIILIVVGCYPDILYCVLKH